MGIGAISNNQIILLAMAPFLFVSIYLVFAYKAIHIVKKKYDSKVVYDILKMYTYYEHSKIAIVLVTTYTAFLFYLAITN